MSVEPSSFNSYFKEFTPPKLPSYVDTETVVFFILNFATFGIYGAAETLAQRYDVKELMSIQEDIHQQRLELTKKWEVLQGEYIECLNDISKGVEGKEKEYIDTKENQLNAKLTLLESKAIQCKSSNEFSFSEAVLGTIAFVGRLLANILTVGFYGVYQNHSLKGKILLLEAQNHYLQKVFEKEKETKIKEINALKENIFQTLQTRKLLIESGKGSELQGITSWQKDKQTLQTELQSIKQQLTALKAEKAKAEIDLQKEKQEKNTLHQKNVEAMQALQKILKEKATYAKSAEDAQLAKEALKKELTALKKGSLNSELQKLLGPILPKYTKRQEDGEIQGAMDFAGENAWLIENQALKEYYDGYNARYGDKLLASEVIQESFDFTVTQLLAMKGGHLQLPDGKKIPLPVIHFCPNSISLTDGIASRPVYHYMILDSMIHGTKLERDKNACVERYYLKINKTLKLVPSNPEYVLQKKADDQGKPAVVVRYTQGDEFTPPENILQLRDGVNMVHAKWIYEQLNMEERAYLTTLLLEPLIENEDPAYQAMRTFISSNSPRAKLVSTCFSLITDMASAIDYKFSENQLMLCWKNLDAQLLEGGAEAPLEKEAKPEIPEEEAIKVTKVTDKPVDWALDENVFSDYNYDLEFPTQPAFYEMVSNTKKKLDVYFNQLSINPNILSHPLTVHPENSDQKPKKIPDDPIEHLTWDMINEQYHVSHLMIGANLEGFGGQRCLFSNLLAVMLSDKKQLTEENVFCLRQAIAAYLDKIKKAKTQWVKEKPEKLDQMSKELEQLKEQAELFDAFEKSILSTHVKCKSVDQYQDWLRNKPKSGHLIDINLLSTLELQLTAWALGLKIGVVYIPIQDSDDPSYLSTHTMVDEYGRLMPTHFFGPNTAGYLLLGLHCSKNLEGTFYGFFPRLNPTDKMNEENPKVYEAINSLENYGKSIGVHK